MIGLLLHPLVSFYERVREQIHWKSLVLYGTISLANCLDHSWKDVMRRMILGGILVLILALTGCEKQEGENLSPAPQDEPAEKEDQPAADIASGLDSFE